MLNENLEKLVENSMPNKINFLGCDLEKVDETKFLKDKNRKEAEARVTYKGRDNLKLADEGDMLEALLRPIGHMSTYAQTFDIEVHREPTHDMDGSECKWIGIPMKNEGVTAPLGCRRYAIKLAIAGMCFYNDGSGTFSITISMQGTETYLNRFVSAFSRCYSTKS